MQVGSQTAAPIWVSTGNRGGIGASKVKSFETKDLACHWMHPESVESQKMHNHSGFTASIGDRRVRVIDLSKIPLDERIAPSQDYFSADALKHLEQARSTFFMSCKGEQRVEDSRLPLLRACSRIETFLPTLARVSEALRGWLSEHAITALQKKHETCPMETYHDGRYCCTKEDFWSMSELAKYPGNICSLILGQQSLTVPDFQEWLSGEKIEKGKVLDRLLAERLIKAGFPLVMPKVFIDRIHRDFANPIAQSCLFMEDSALDIYLTRPAQPSVSDSWTG